MTKRQCKLLATKWFNWFSEYDPYAYPESTRHFVVHITTGDLFFDTIDTAKKMIDDILKCAEEDGQDIKNPEYSGILNAMFRFLDKANNERKAVAK